MAQIFHPAMNVVARVTILGGLLIVAVAAWAAGQFYRSPYITEVHVIRDQPVPFSHEHHVRGLGLDCRYCHTTVENSAFAGLPATKTCMTCHSQIWLGAPVLEPVRESWRTGQPLHWTRVNQLPHFVYFDHSIHVNKGVSCVTCHGQVDEMPLMWRENTLLMRWCLDCHRNPSPNLRPRNEVFDMQWKRGAADPAGTQLLDKYEVNVKQLENCSVCHR
jgi:hypothetical protein